MAQWDLETAPSFLGGDWKVEHDSESRSMPCSSLPFRLPAGWPHCSWDPSKMSWSGYRQKPLLLKKETRSQPFLTPPFNMNMEVTQKFCTNCWPCTAKYTEFLVERTGSHLPHPSFLPGKARYNATLKETRFLLFSCLLLYVLKLAPWIFSIHIKNILN